VFPAIAPPGLPFDNDNLFLRIGDHPLGEYAHDHHGQNDDRKGRKYQAKNRCQQEQ
jgi:hypothetical protein